MKRNISIVLSLVLVTIPFLQAVAASGSLKDVVTPGFSFTQDLQLGDNNDQVLQLQKVLNADVDTTVALQGTGSVGHETTYFGDATKQAVIKFQDKYADTILIPYGLTQGTGLVGLSTRTKLNVLIGVTNTYPSVGSVPTQVVSKVLTSTAYIAPAVTVTSNVSSGNSLSVCQFIQLMSGIGVVNSVQANQGLVSFGCSVPNTHTSVNNSSTSANSTDNGNNGFALSSDTDGPTLDLRANGSSGPITITQGQNFILSWVATKATVCSSGSNKNLPTNATQVTTPSVSTSYTVTCINSSGGSVTRTVVVNVTPTSSSSNQPSVDLKINGQDTQVTVDPSSGPVITWTSNNVATCKIDTAQVSTNGSIVVPNLPPNQSAPVSITCTGSNGSVVSDSVTINTTAASINNGNGFATSTGSSLENQVANSHSNTFVSFSGVMHVGGTCYGTNDFYKVDVTPYQGQPVVTNVTGGGSENTYTKGNANTTLELLYWQHGNIAVPMDGSVVLGAADGVQTYNCDANSNYASSTNNIVKGGVIYNIGETNTLNTASSQQNSGSVTGVVNTNVGTTSGFGSATLTPYSSAYSGGTTMVGKVPEADAQIAASKIPAKPSGGLGLTTIITVVATVAAIAACAASAVGCVALAIIPDSIAIGVGAAVTGAVVGQAAKEVGAPSTVPGL